MKSFWCKDAEDQPPSQGTHTSTTDPDAQLYRKGRGKEAELSFIGHLLMNEESQQPCGRYPPDTGRRNGGNQYGTGDAEGSRWRITVSADKAYDAATLVDGARAMNATPHKARNINADRGSNIDARTTRHAGYATSQLVYKRIEEPNGKLKTMAGMHRAPFQGHRAHGLDVYVPGGRL